MSILPVSRGSYIIGEFKTFHTFTRDDTKIKKIDLATLKSTTLVGKNNYDTLDLTPIDPKDAVLDSPRCLAKIGNLLYFCVSTTALGQLDLNTNILTVIAGRIPTDANSYGPTDPLGDKFSSIRAIYVNNGHLFIVDTDMIKKIDLSGTTYSDFAGVSGSGLQADGIGVTANFNTLTSSTLLNGDLYVGDSVDSSSTNLRKINLTTGLVTTVVGDIGNPINFGDEAVDGIGPLASINSFYGLTVFEDKLVLLDQYSNLKVRIFDPATASLTTIKTINVNGTKNILGTLSDKASLRSFRVRSIYYAENYGLVIGAEYGLFRLQ